MPDATKQIAEKFELRCKQCGGMDVVVEFYSGFIHDSGGDVGSLSIQCQACKARVEVDDEA